MKITKMAGIVAVVFIGAFLGLCSFLNEESVDALFGSEGTTISGEKYNVMIGGGGEVRYLRFAKEGLGFDIDAKGRQLRPK
jgi:hypothetical protein